MQLRKHAAPPLGGSFFTAGVAVPPDFTGAGAKLATGPTDLPPLPPGPEGEGLGRKADDRKCNDCQTEAAIHKRLPWFEGLKLN